MNTGTAEGPRGGEAAGATVTGPQGNTAGRAVGVGADGGVAAAGGVRGADGRGAARGAAVGPDGGAVAGRAVQGPDGGAAARGVAVGPEGGVAAAGGVRGPDGGAAARGVAVGADGGVAAARGVRGPDGGAAAGFARVNPSNRYMSATAVRTNYDHWDAYNSGWYTDHPGAWYAAGWASGAAWRAATWNSVGAWMNYYPTTPAYYDYGTNITYQNDKVYVDGQDSGSTEQYYQQASELAQSGATADAPADGEWLPLGVFALTKAGESNSIVTIQLAVNKQGVIRGNYTDTKTNKTMVIQGAVDKKTQMVAFSVGEKKTNLIETGLYNLTKDEAPALIHIGDGKTEQYLLVRLKNDNDTQDASEPATS